MENQLEKYCVIGAGPSGLMTARSFKKANIPFEILEKYSDVGGIWQASAPSSPVYKTAHFISSKHVSYIPGYPFANEYPDYPSNQQILAYLKSFSKKEKLAEGIQFNTEVEDVYKEEDHWVVKLKDGFLKKYKGVIICCGFTSIANLPDIPGEFDGEIFHSQKYKELDQLKNKKVLIVGGGNSGVDIACEAALVSNGAVISLRRGYYFFPKHILGSPSDALNNKLPTPYWIQRIVAKFLLKIFVGDLTKYGLPKPDHEPLQSHPIINSQILHYLSHGDLKVAADVASFKGRSVLFKDGTEEEFDLIIYATGYKKLIPFLDKKYLKKTNGDSDLFLNLLSRSHEDLFVIGMLIADSGAFDLIYKQVEMVTNLIIDKDKTLKRELLFKKEPDLKGGMTYLNSERHESYSRANRFHHYFRKQFKKFNWSMKHN